MKIVKSEENSQKSGKIIHLNQNNSSSKLPMQAYRHVAGNPIIDRIGCLNTGQRCHKIGELVQKFFEFL